MEVPKPTLNTFSKLVEKDITKAVKSNPAPKHYNVIVLERRASNELKSNHKIVIKPSDKGGTIVVQNSKDYVAQAMRQLSNDTFYQHLSSNPKEQLMKDRDCVLDKALRNN